jgi:hypothetical protein
VQFLRSAGQVAKFGDAPEIEQVVKVELLELHRSVFDNV